MVVIVWSAAQSQILEPLLGASPLVRVKCHAAKAPPPQSDDRRLRPRLVVADAKKEAIPAQAWPVHRPRAFTKPHERHPALDPIIKTIG